VGWRQRICGSRDQAGLASARGCHDAYAARVRHNGADEVVLDIAADKLLVRDVIDRKLVEPQHRLKCCFVAQFLEILRAHSGCP
jgi:hypothetical protein